MKGGTIFVVVGRLGATLTLSKLLPVKYSGLFEKIYVFREKEGIALDGAQYITTESLSKIKPGFIRKLFQRFMEIFQLIYFSVKLKPDLINGYQLLPKGIISFIASKIAGVPCMISSIGGIPEIDTYLKPTILWKSINLYILKRSNIVTTKGSLVTNYIAKHGVDKKNIHTFNGAIDTERFSKINDIKRDIDLIFVGGLIELKGPDRFVRILDVVRKQHPGLKSIILGDGYMKTIVKQLIDSYNLENTVLMLGHCSNPEIYFGKAKIMIMPSRSEGLSTAMLEAMACGCIPVISDVGCMSEAAHHGINAVLIDDYMDIQSFANETILLLKDEERLQNMSAEATNMVREKYSIEAQASIFRDIVDGYFFEGIKGVS